MREIYPKQNPKWGLKPGSEPGLEEYLRAITIARGVRLSPDLNCKVAKRYPGWQSARLQCGDSLAEFGAEG
ncbi:MAG: hypothetical protein PsegKO_02530 [Pseudohongiellaceae bacterium]